MNSSRTGHTESAAARLVSAVTSLLPASPLHPPLVHSKSPTGHHHHHASQPHHSIQVFDSKLLPPCSSSVPRTAPPVGGEEAGQGDADAPKAVADRPKLLGFPLPLGFSPPVVRRIPKSKL